MLMTIWTIILFIIALGILIAFHEFGHFWVARRLGVKVLRFSIGFGKPLLSFYDRRGTEYALAAFPLGGYVKMLDENEADVLPQERHLAFNRQTLWKRALIVAAGPVFNIILAIVAYWLMFVIGITTLAPILGPVAPNSIAAKGGLVNGDMIVAINGERTPSWNAVNLAFISHLGNQGEVTVTAKAANTGLLEEHQLDLKHWRVDMKRQDILSSLGLQPLQPKVPTIVDKTVAHGPAARAGVLADDRIISINNQKINNWYDLKRALKGKVNQQLKLTVNRDGKLMDLTIVPEPQQGNSQEGFIGVKLKPVKLPEEMLHIEAYSPWHAIWPALVKTANTIGLTFVLLGKLIMGKVSLTSISGPIGIAQGATVTASMGFSYFLGFMALISVSLGIINILPIPVLDGGHLLYYVIELIRRKPLSRKAQEIGFRIGILLLILLMTIAIVNDINRIFS